MYSNTTELPGALIMTKRGLESPAAVRARELCEQHIDRHYPTYKQLNILRVGTPEEIAAMGAFIDACRTWSNGESPDPAALEAIQP